MLEESTEFEDYQDWVMLNKLLQQNSINFNVNYPPGVSLNKPQDRVDESL
jgi:hypothetical protein